MKTSEIVKKLNEISGIQVFSKNRISILDSTSECLAEVGIFGSWLHIYNNCPNEVAQLLFEYYLTPLEEREEEKKYRLYIPFYKDHIYCLNFLKESKGYCISSPTETERHKTQFTQKEIDAMPFDTNFFIKEEVI